ncbi:platelet glycoprotein V-like [Spea bombifrons]|uniref:platelet glycoprotein V-like n=1 Tax=Spea bombifrons TaxID=233779 RepID=UPI002349647E|nr:platelet glycoprotein V-like [Spea bombifrons]
MLFILLLTVPTIVDAFCPAQCTCIIKDAVKCAGSSITDISMLTIPSNFTYILIKDTLATELTDKTFQQMPVTLRLLLESNQFSTVSVGAFKGFSLLKSLKLSNNKIQNLPSGVFDTLTDLDQLMLDKNYLVELDTNLFSKLANLEELFLNRNRLTKLPDGLLSGLKKLKILNLSRNKITELSTKLFSSLTNLETLHLYDNKLKEIYSCTFQNLGELTELTLYSNEIQTIAEDAFNHSPKMNILKLSKNQLQTLPDGLFLHLPELSTLALYENPLTKLPPVLFGKMDNLQSLWLYHTELTTVPDFVFSNLTNLQLLVLTRNPKLHSLPNDAFKGLTTLSELSLHTNNLTSLEKGLFEELKNLESLSLYNNNFKVLPGNLFNSLKNLQFIYLNNSRLQTVPGELFHGLPNLKLLRLDGNHWACDCKLVDFIAWLTKNSKTVENARSLLCESPLKMMTTPILDAKELSCLHTTAMGMYSDSTTATPTSYQWSSLSSVTKRPTHSKKTAPATTEEQIHTTTPLITSAPFTATKEKDHEETSSTTYHYITRSSYWDKKDQIKTTVAGMSSTRTTTLSTIIHTNHSVFPYGGPFLNFNIPLGKTILTFLLLTAALQIVLIFVTCFGLFKMIRLYRYFKGFTQPVILLRVLIPLSSKSQIQSLHCQ